MSHPSPFAYRKRPIPDDVDIVGWFLVAFNDGPDHEYPFALHRDGTILPQLDFTDTHPEFRPDLRAMFAEYLADPTLHHVRYQQNEPVTPDERDAAIG